jgi:ribosomal protein S18 acetylase RimI-like enzyme
VTGASDKPAVKGDVTVGACDETDEPAVLTLLADAFGRWPTALDIEPGAFFRWKHTTSPFGPSTMLVAKVDGQAAGFLALMPWRLRFADAVHETVRGVDIAVAPQFQRLGVANALIRAARGTYGSDIVLGWSNPNDQSRHGVLKTGRRRVDGLPRYIGSGGATLGTVSRMLASGTPGAAGNADESLAVALADDALLARILSGPRASARISTAYDADFLRWRYGRQGGYRAVVREHPRAGAGIAIFHIPARGRFTVACISELLTERDDGRAVRELVRGVRRAARTDFLVCAFPSSGAAHRCGLLRSPRTAMVAANPLREGLVPDPTRSSSWTLSLGDLELI